MQQYARTPMRHHAGPPKGMRQHAMKAHAVTHMRRCEEALAHATFKGAGGGACTVRCCTAGMVRSGLAVFMHYAASITLVLGAALGKAELGRC